MSKAVLLAAAGLYALNQWILKGTGLPFFQAYMNDVLAGAALLAIANMISPPRHPVGDFVSSILGSLIIITIASFVWEVLAPLVLERSRGDPVDVLAYFAGAGIYLMINEIGARRAQRKLRRA